MITALHKSKRPDKDGMEHGETSELVVCERARASTQRPFAGHHYEDVPITERH